METTPCIKVFGKKITSGQGGFVEFKNWHEIVTNSNQRNYMIMNIEESVYRKMLGQPLYIGRKSFNAIEFAFVMNKGLPDNYKENINKAMTIIQENGIYKKLDRQYILASVRKNRLIEPSQQVVQPIKLKSMSTMFGIFFLALLSSALVISIEKIVHYCHDFKQHYMS